MKLEELCCYQGVGQESPWQGIHRVLHIQKPNSDGMGAKRGVVTIAMQDDFGTWLTFHNDYDALNTAIALGKLVQANVVDRPIECMDDETITANYPPRKKSEKSAPLAIREERKKLIAPIVFRPETELRKNGDDLFERKTLTNAIVAVAKTNGYKGTGYIRSILRIYFRGGMTIASMLPDLSNCGGFGKERDQKRKLGRPNRSVKAGYPERAGVPLSEEDKQIIASFWESAVKEGKSPEYAFDIYSAIFHHESITFVAGEPVVQLKPIGERPTLSQFQRWGQQQDPNRSASILLLNERERDYVCRPRTGSERDGIEYVGQLAIADGTPVDVNLVALDNPLKHVGVGNRISAIDAKTGLILGAHFFYGKARAEDALLTMYRIASSKNELGTRLGIPEQLNDNTFPPILPKEFRVDHGEFFTVENKAAANDLHVDLTFAPSGQGSMKGGVESHHHAGHKMVDRHLLGANEGRQRKPGEKDSRLPACLNMNQYQRQWWKWAHYQNCVELVDELMTVELRREAAKRYPSFQPTRINIFNLLRELGYVGYEAYSPALTQLRRRLLPTVKARIYPEGIRLLSPESGGKDVIVRPFIYRSDIFYAQRWDLLAGTKQRDIVVRYDPEDPTVILAIDRRAGMIEFRAESNDPILLREAHFDDLLRFKELDALNAALQQDNVDQARVNLRLSQQLENRVAKQQKQEAGKALPKKPSKREQFSGIQANQREERARLQETMRSEIVSNGQPTVPVGDSVIQRHGKGVCDQPTVAVDELFDSHSDGGGSIKARRLSMLLEKS